MPIVYEDEDSVVNKPAGLLCAGVEIEDSALSRIKNKYPNATGAILLHRGHEHLWSANVHTECQGQ